jgi:predicted metal-binding membrane protein
MKTLNSCLDKRCLLLVLLLPSIAAAADPPTLNMANTAWMLTSSLLVLFMTLPGLALFYAGMVRKKNILATLAQWGLHSAALLSPMMVSTSPILGGLVLLAAGGFQWTPLKYTCLTHCRSPLGFLMTDWREGHRGALIMGLQHGMYCVGCCWFLMALLFVAGVMNLLWVAAIAAFVLVEKVVPRGDLVGRVAGGGLVLAGLVMLGQALST